MYNFLYSFFLRLNVLHNNPCLWKRWPLLPTWAKKREISNYPTFSWLYFIYIHDSFPPILLCVYFVITSMYLLKLHGSVRRVDITTAIRIAALHTTYFVFLRNQHHLMHFFTISRFYKDLRTYSKGWASTESLNRGEI